MPRLLGGIIVQAKKFCGVWATTLSFFSCDNTLIACWRSRNLLNKTFERTGSRPNSLCANIPETPVVLLINEQGEKEKGSDDRKFSWCCSFFWGFGWRGTERRRAKRAAAQWVR